MYYVIIHSNPPAFMCNDQGEPVGHEEYEDAKHAAEHKCVGARACGYTIMDNESQEFTE